MKEALEEILKAHPRMKNMLGLRFGKLTVVAFDHIENNRAAYWKCKCDCGNYTVVNGCHLRSKISPIRSCGCIIIEKNRAKRTDLTNKRFGSLVAISYDDNKQAWLCKCDCGNTKYIKGSSLLKGATTSCGCLTKAKSISVRTSHIIGKKFHMLTVLEYNSELQKYKCRCDCGNITYVNGGKLREGWTKSCGCIDTAHKGSTAENEIKDYILTNFTGIHITKEKSILNGYEIDMYIKELKVGIEYNGSAFHASIGGAFRNLDKYYHRNKFLMAKDKGIRLITIFDKDYEDNKEKVLSIIKNILENREVNYFVPVDNIVYTNNDYDDGLWLEKFGYKCVGQIEPESFIYSNRFTVYRCGKSMWKRI